MLQLQKRCSLLHQQVSTMLYVSIPAPPCSYNLPGIQAKEFPYGLTQGHRGELEAAAPNIVGLESVRDADEQLERGPAPSAGAAAAAPAEAEPEPHLDAGAAHGLRLDPAAHARHDRMLPHLAPGMSLLSTQATTLVVLVLRHCCFS